jgi:hypothetical protein
MGESILIYKPYTLTCILSADYIHVPFRHTLIYVVSFQISQVRGFADEIATKSLADTHRIFKFNVSPADGGYLHIQNRPRTYRLLVSRRCRMLADPHELYEKVKAAFQPLNKVARLQHLVHAAPEEIQAALKKRCRCSSKCRCTFLSQLTPAQVFVQPSYRCCFENDVCAGMCCTRV